MTIEFWHAVFQWGAVILVALTFVFVTGALWIGNALREQEAVRVERLEAEIARAQTASARIAAPIAPAGAARIEPPDRAARTLEPAARATLLEALRQARPEGPVAIRFVSGSTTEPATFARALADVIEEAGWMLADADSSGAALGEPPVGLLVRVSERGDTPRRASVLEESLNRAGLAAGIERSSAVRTGTVELMVGVRP